MQPLTLIGEVFGLAGRQQDVRIVTEPRAQVGLRWTPAKAFDLELIYGRNILGENANLFTVGANFRFYRVARQTKTRHGLHWIGEMSFVVGHPDGL